MAKYIFAYHGVGSMANQSPAEAKAVMDAWGAWFGSLGAAVIDGGHPCGPSGTVRSDGSMVAGGGANPISGYSLIECASHDDAWAKAKGCPILQAGGSIEIAQCMDM